MHHVFKNINALLLNLIAVRFLHFKIIKYKPRYYLGFFIKKK